MSHQVPRLRPLGVADLLDEMIRLYRSHFLLLAGVAAIVLAPLYTAQYLLGWFAERSDSLLTIVGGYGVWTVLAILGNVAVNLAITCAVSEIYLGRRPTIGGTYAGGLQRLGTAVALSIVLTVVLVLLTVTVIGIPVAVYLGVCWALCFQTLLLERLGIRAALGRSRALVRGRWWRVLGVIILVGILSSIVGLVVSLPAVAFQIMAATAPEGLLQAVFSVIGAAFQIASQVLLAPIWFCGAVLLYYDLRIRKEGFDLELMAQEMAAPLGAGPTGS